MIAIIILLLILSISFGIKIKLRIKQEEAICISLFGMVLFTYLLGIINLLPLAIYIVPIFAAFSLIYTIVKLIKKQEKLKELITLPTIVYSILMIIIYFVVKDLKFQIYDEFMFWGTNLKVMVNQDVLWAHNQVDGIHLVYPPFTAIAEYIMCKYNGKFTEGVAYFGIISLMLTTLIPLLKKEKYNIKSAIKILLTITITYTAIILFGYKIAGLCVDCFLGIILAVMMYLAYNIEKKEDYILLTVMLISTTLVKTNGILISGIVIMQIFFQKTLIIIKEKNKKLKNIVKEYLIVIILLSTIILTYATWKIYYTANGKQIDDRHDKNYTSQIDLGEFVNALSLNGKASLRNTQIVKTFISKMLDVSLTIGKNFNTTIWLSGTFSIVFVMLVILKKEKEKIFINYISIYIGCAIYILFTLFIYMFVFQAKQGEEQLEFSRYIGIYMLAIFLDIMYLIFETANIKSEIISILILIIMQRDINIELYNPKRFRHGTNEIIKASAYQIKEQVSEDKKIYIIDQKLDYGYEFMQLRYFISPIKTNLLYEWNLVRENQENTIYYRFQISDEDFMDKLISESYEYVYIMSINSNFLEDYKNIISHKCIEILKDKIVDNNMIIFPVEKEGVLLKIDKENRKLEI